MSLVIVMIPEAKRVFDRYFLRVDNVEHERASISLEQVNSGAQWIREPVVKNCTAPVYVAPRVRAAIKQIHAVDPSILLEDLYKTLETPGPKFKQE